MGEKRGREKMGADGEEQQVPRTLQSVLALFCINSRETEGGSVAQI